MKIFIAIFILSLIDARAQEATNSAATAPAAAVDPASFEAFKMLAQKNIFDPNRAAPGQPRPQVEQAPRRTEAFTLVGSIAYEKGEFAFFEGTSPEYRKSVKAGDSIASY